MVGLGSDFPLELSVSAMAQYIVHGLNGTHCFQHDGSMLAGDVTPWLKAQIEQVEGIPALHQVLQVNALSAGLDSDLNTSIARLSIRIDGGKGGFGTLLRGGGANKQGPVNNDSSRDLDGRRLRDAQALSKIQRALEKKQAALNGTPLPDSEDEEEAKHSKKKKFKRKSKETKAEVESEVLTEEESKFAAKHAKEARIRQVHKAVVEDTMEAVQAGFSASVEKKASPPTAKATLSVYGDIYADVSSDEEDEESEESESEESEVEAPKAAPRRSSKPTSNGSSSSSSSELSSSAPASSKKPIENDLPVSNRDAAKRTHTAMSDEALLDLTKYEDSVALEALGLDRLKQELSARGLMIGGTLTQRAVRLFQVRGLAADQYPPELVAKAKKTKT